MSVRDDDRPDPKTGRLPMSRSKVAASALGLALLGGGAYAITAQLTDRDASTVTEETGALAPVVPAASASASASAPHAATGPVPSAPASSAAATASPTAKHSPRPAPKKTDSAAIQKEVAAARAAAEKDGHPLQRALTAAPDVAAADVTQRTVTTAEGTIRVTTARADLTGQQELLMAADHGQPVGDARCTKNLRFSNSATPREIPTLLLCWRTSATRSVVTLAVAKKGRPSTASSAAVLNREWEKLG